MELRKLKSDDLFPMFEILSKIGFQDLKQVMDVDKIESFMDAVSNSDKVKEGNVDPVKVMGVSVIADVLQIVMKNLPSCRKEIYTFLSNVSGMKTKEIGELPPGDLVRMITQVIRMDEFMDFFSAVSELFK